MSSSNDDASAFRRAMAGVRARPAAPMPPAPPRPRAAARFSHAAPPGVPHEQPHGARDVHVAEEHGTVQYRRPGVRDAVLRDLRRGRIVPEGEIDLHGLSRHAALARLREFLGLALARRLRCIRVVHGKGLRSGAGGPVLKLAVVDLLARCDDVQAFVSARAVDGGSGATCVLLRVRGADTSHRSR